MDITVDQMKRDLISTLGLFYARRLMRRTKRKELLSKKDICCSIEDYFKLKDDRYWHDLYGFCKEHNIPWELKVLQRKFSNTFDKKLEENLNDAGSLYRIFLSYKTFAEACGKPCPDTPICSKKARRITNEENHHKPIEKSESVRKESHFKPIHHRGEPTTSRRFGKPDYSFFDDWDYH